MKFMIIDDNYFNVNVLEEMLRDIDPQCLVLTAFSGPQALKKLKEQDNFEFIFIDFNMPEMNGIQVA